MIDVNDLIGVPFVNGGRTKESGFDCWGLVCEVFRRCGKELTDYRISCKEASLINGAIECNRQFWDKVEMPDKEAPCLMVMRFNHPYFLNHTGVYLGAGIFIHTRERLGVNIDRVDSPAWKRLIEGYYKPRPEAIM